MKTCGWLIFLTLLAGCGALEVKVDVIDPTYVREMKGQITLKRALEATLAQQDSKLKQALENQKQKQANIYKNLASRYREDAKASNLSEAAKVELKGIADDLENEVVRLDKPYSESYNELVSANKAIRDTFFQLRKEDQQAILTSRKPIDGALAGALQARTATSTAFLVKVQTEVGKLESEIEKQLTTPSNNTAPVDKAPAKNVKVALADAKQNIENVEKELRGFGDLSKDDVAYIISSAPKEQWTEANFARGAGKLGSVDIAIKAEGKTRSVKGIDFTIKGITFDPSVVAQVASKAGTQALLMASQIAGIPVSGSPAQDASAGKALAVSSGRLAGDQERTAIIEANLRDVRAALFDIAALIVSHEAAIDTSVKDDVAKAVSAINAGFARHKGRLGVSPASDK